MKMSIHANKLVSMVFFISSTLWAQESIEEIPREIIEEFANLELERDFVGLFQNLLQRDEFLSDFVDSENRVASICVDWEKIRRVNSYRMLLIEHYWIEYDEDFVSDMEDQVMSNCKTWVQENETSCDCQLLISNNNVELGAPGEVIDKFTNAIVATVKVQSDDFVQQYTDLENLRSSGNLLSEEDGSPYKIIEAIQNNACDLYGDRSFGCQTSDLEDCIDSTNDIGVSLGYTGAEVDEIACTKISTRYAAPGTHEMLHRFFFIAKAAFELSGYKINSDFAMSTLPNPQINVSISSEKMDDSYLVLFNEKFFSFAYEMAKVATFTLPFGMGDEDVIEFDPSNEELLDFLDNNFQVEQDFSDTVLYFLGVKDRAQIIPPEVHRPVLLSYTSGMETFALSHEIAHSLLGHNSHSNLQLEAGECNAKSSGSYIDELEADYLASQVMLKIRDLNAACGGYTLDHQSGLSVVGENYPHCSNQPFNLVYPLTPEFYFLAKEISEDACSIVTGGDNYNEEQEIGVIEFARECEESENCNFLADAKNQLPDELINLNRHPSPSTRRKLSNIWMNDNDLKGFDNPVSSIGNSLSRNSEVIWGRVRKTIEEEITQ